MIDRIEQKPGDVDDPHDGWTCPHCGSRRWSVESVYMTRAGRRRRRVCTRCNHGMIRTTERPDGVKD